jgi:uncharacterized protein YhhL (DUF1145 family)
MIGVLIQLVVLGLILYAVWWFVGYVNLPEPFNKVVRVLVGLIALVIVIYMLLDVAGIRHAPLLWR